MRHTLTTLIPAAAVLITSSWQVHAQGDSLAIAQLRCAALVAAVERVSVADYLDRLDAPGYFTMLRRHKPLFNRCMAACDVVGAPVSCALQQQSAAVAARYQELLNKSAQDALAEGWNRLRKGQ
jgi:hypothetical protein